MTIAVFLGSLMGLMALGMPIAFALLGCGVALMLQQDLFETQTLAQKFIEGADSFPLLAVPFFILSGEIMNVGGLSRRIIDFAMSLFGHIKGGLGYVAILAAVILSSLSGSAIADAAALATFLIPLMTKAGYDRNRSSGLIAASGIIGPIIPPSIGFVIFGVVCNVSITRLFLGGVVPGLMLGVALAIAWAWAIRKDTIVTPPRKSLREVTQSLIDGAWALVMPVIIIGGLKFGIFTPTEAGVVCVVYALFVSLVVYREMTLKDLYRCFAGSAMATATIMFLVAATLVSAWLITVADLPGEVVRLLEPFIDQPILLMLMIQALLVVVGMPLDMLPTILILGPVLMPLTKAAGIDPVYFGVLFIINTSIGLITPPIGTVLNTVCGVAKISMDDITKGIWPFLVAELLVLLLLILFPELVTVPAKFLYEL